MIVTNKENIVNGNTVMVPNYKPDREKENEKYKKIKKEQQQSQKKLKKQALKHKISVIKLIALIFAFGFVVIYRYAGIYKMQAELTNVRSEIDVLKSENEEYKINLVKSGNLNSIQDAAVNKLHMVKPDSSNTMKVDFSKNNFTPKIDTKNDKKEEPMSVVKSFIDKLLSF